MGVDLVPLKTCTLNCVFCQAGLTTTRTMERAEYVPLDEVMKELHSWMEGGGVADYITLSGSGEPTLYSRFGEVVRAVRDMTSIKTALLTNGSLMYLPEVRKGACEVHLAKISLSCWDQMSFEKVLRPHTQLKFNNVFRGISDFRDEFNGTIWLEVFIVPGINDGGKAVKKIAELAKAVSPDKIHLNTAVRPPAEESVKPAPREKLEELAGLFTPKAEII